MNERLRDTIRDTTPEIPQLRIITNQKFFRSEEHQRETMNHHDSLGEIPHIPF